MNPIEKALAEADAIIGFDQELEAVLSGKIRSPHDPRPCRVCKTNIAYRGAPLYAWVITEVPEGGIADGTSAAFCKDSPTGHHQPSVRVGDFFVTSWGYDETHVEWYRVLGFTPSGKSVRVQEWSTHLVDESGCGQDYVVPSNRPARKWGWNKSTGARVEFDAPVETKRLNLRWDEPSISFESFRSGSLWKGDARYETSSGWGR